MAFPEFWYEWSAQLAEFGDSYFAVAPDLRGFNLSDMPAMSRPTKQTYCEDLALLIGYLGYQKAIHRRPRLGRRDLLNWRLPCLS